MQTVVDCFWMLIHVFGSPGKVHDARVFSNSSAFPQRKRRHTATREVSMKLRCVSVGSKDDEDVC